MDLLTSPFPLVLVPAGALVLIALLVARAVTAFERRVVTSAAVLLAGLFFLVKSGGEPVEAGVGAVAWGLGLGGFVDAALAWQRGAASRLWPLAAVFLLPPAFAGAVLAGGIVVSLLSG